ncbi:DUF2213 domain-containing protein [Stenomitos frigidus]|uniref:DUF2213 domain-containing protein n=1 Tax=Stenomitos frigidus AS-A4 TaxID=2933935 RepID=A0ABV0KEW4_9CYAN
MATAIRFNQLATIERFDSRDGVMTVTAIAREPGILTYRNADGSTRRELVSREFLRRTDSDGKPLVAQLADLPVTREHPPCLLRNDDALLEKYQVGRTQNKVHVFDDGRVQVTFDVYDPETQDDIRFGRKDGVSVGYETNVRNDAGEWHGEAFDALQDEPMRKDHMAVCSKPRAAGAKIKTFRFDSADTNDIAWQIEPAIEAPIPTVRKDAPVADKYQIELTTPQGKRPFWVPMDLYIEIKERGLDDCGCHADAADMVPVFDTTEEEYRVDSEGELWRFDKKTGTGKKCPGGYSIPASKNCNPKTQVKKNQERTQQLREKFSDGTKRAAVDKKRVEQNRLRGITPEKGKALSNVSKSASSRSKSGFSDFSRQSAPKKGKNKPSKQAITAAAETNRAKGAARNKRLAEAGLNF